MTFAKNILRMSFNSESAVIGDPTGMQTIRDSMWAPLEST